MKTDTRSVLPCGHADYQVVGRDVAKLRVLRVVDRAAIDRKAGGEPVMLSDPIELPGCAKIVLNLVRIDDDAVAVGIGIGAAQSLRDAFPFRKRSIGSVGPAGWESGVAGRGERRPVLRVRLINFPAQYIGVVVGIDGRGIDVTEPGVAGKCKRIAEDVANDEIEGGGELVFHPLFELAQQVEQVLEVIHHEEQRLVVIDLEVLVHDPFHLDRMALHGGRLDAVHDLAVR